MSFSRRSFLYHSGAAALVSALPSLRCAAADSPAQTLQRKLAADPLRPQYHLMPAANWMNDPNGPIYFRGRYHMFFQYNPNAPVWGDMHWNHATSPDMIHWHHEPVAIAPTPGGYDRDGVFSGSAVLDHGVPTAIYTGVMPPANDGEATLRDGQHTWREVQCLATSSDPDLRTWKKLPEPVIPYPPPGLEVTGFRDPTPWREGDSWLLTVGSGFKNRGGAVLLYRSSDLRHWTYLHPLVEGSGNGQTTINPVDKGEMWECPDFFPLGGKHVLLMSTVGKVRYKVGTYKDLRFYPEKDGVVDWGAYYAAKTMLDRGGSRILWGWIPETRPEAEHRAAGWAGAMALPRILSLNADNELQMDVAPVAKTLRATNTRVSKDMSAAAREEALSGLRIKDLAAEISAEFQPKSNGSCSLTLRPDSGEAFATITVSAKGDGWQLDAPGFSAPLSQPANRPLRLHLFLDGSVLEIFANGTTVATARIYKAPTSPLRIETSGELVALDVWQVQPISKDRLTT